MASNGIKPQVFNSAFTLIKLTLISPPEHRLNTTCKRLAFYLLYSSKTSLRMNTTSSTSFRPSKDMLKEKKERDRKKNHLL